MWQENSWYINNVSGNLVFWHINLCQETQFSGTWFMCHETLVFHWFKHVSQFKKFDYLEIISI
jgi:hypothetical protein